jgi:hypothetical protein
MSVPGQILLQNSQKAMRSISRKLTKRAAITDRYRLKAVTEVACEFIADYVVPVVDSRHRVSSPPAEGLADLPCPARNEARVATAFVSLNGHMKIRR